MKNAFAAIFALGLAVQAAPLLAQNYEQAILAQLRQDGYEQITVTTTLLGRIRIVADGAQGQREIVLNPRTGEVLRDVLLLANLADDDAYKGGSSGKSNGSSGGSPSSGGSSGNGSSGSGGSGGSGSSGSDDDDDRDDDDDDNRNDDNDNDSDEDEDDEDEDEDDDSGKGRGRGGDDD